MFSSGKYSGGRAAASSGAGSGSLTRAASNLLDGTLKFWNDPNGTLAETWKDIKDQWMGKQDTTNAKKP